jgi:hypothetical protein
MQIKNLAIALLAISNILCLFIIIGQKTKLHSNYNADPFVTTAFYDKEMLGALKENLMGMYNISEATCGAAVGLSKKSCIVGTARFDMACLLRGSRKIAWATLQDVKSELIGEYSTFAQLAQAENIKEMDGVSYRPEDKRNALLFIKQKIFYERNDFRANDYLRGYLLGYNIKDIEFFYKRWAFMMNRSVELLSSVPGSYVEFSPELKKQFEQYIKEGWPGTTSQMRYESEKNDALKWLEENKNFSDEQLYEQIQELKKVAA